jgi:hypothetical protein
MQTQNGLASTSSAEQAGRLKQMPLGEKKRRAPLVDRAGLVNNFPKKSLHY